MDIYKQKYEQALERAKVINPGTADYEVAVKIFPELKENEDEIFKELVYNLIVSNDSTPSSKEIFSTYGKTKEDLHAWLEKQGKQSLEDKVNEAMREVEEKAKVFTARHKGETTEEILAKMRGEQKPAEWSEDDESIMSNLCHFLEEYGNRYYGQITLQSTISWLKSLRPQSKQKLSKEDEKLLNLSLENLTELKNRFGEKYGKVGDCIFWLKSLKERMKGETK